MFDGIRGILGYYRQYWAIAAISIVAASLLDLLDVVVSYTIGQLLNILSGQPIDNFLQPFIQWCNVFVSVTSERNQALWVLLGIIFLASVGRAPIHPWVGNWYNWAIPLRAGRDQIERAVVKILSLPLSFYDENNPGRVLSLVLRGISNHTLIYPSIAQQFFPKLIRVLGVFGFMLLVEWRIAIVFLISFIAIFALSIQSIIAIAKRDKDLESYKEKTDSRISEIITNIKTVKAFGSERAELDRQSQRLDRHLAVYLHRIHKGLVSIDVWRQLVVQASTFGILVLSLMAVLQNRISIGHFITIITLSSMAYAQLYPISRASENFARFYAPMARFHTFMQQSEVQRADSLVQPIPKVDNPYQFAGQVQLCQLGFGYDSDRPVLEDINLLIEPCQTVALVGRSGAGKSTLVKLLFRYFEPSSGDILIDGENIRDLDVTHYRRRLAIVHQEVDVFNKTLLDNLLYGNPTASADQIKEACQVARVDEFVDDLPQGYHTIIGERGVRLSGGQRQRLGIARALLMDPDILIFDEATSSLDYESERLIQQAMKSILGTRTTIIIAHRLSTVREADKIVVLDAGRIAEVGNHQELLNHGGVYQYLHALQESGDIIATDSSNYQEPCATNNYQLNGA